MQQDTPRHIIQLNPITNTKSGTLLVFILVCNCLLGILVKFDPYQYQRRYGFVTTCYTPCVIIIHLNTLPVHTTIL